MADHDSSQPNYELAWLAGGAALMLFGAGVLASSPTVREMVGRVVPKSPGDDNGLATPSLAGILPDVERYLKIRSM